jgi:hypothetical protein
MDTAIVCTALLGLLLFGLGLLVSNTRVGTRTNFGYKPDPTDRLYRAVRAHGNAAEYAPMLAVLMLAVGARGPSTWMLAAMVVATAARYTHAVGMLTGPSLDAVHPARFAGSLGTYVSGLALVIALLVG